MSLIMRNLFLPYTNNKGAHQPAHPRSMISTFVIRCLDSIISLSFYIRNLKPLASFCGCAGRFESYLVENPKDRFSHDEALIITFNHKLSVFNVCCDPQWILMPSASCQILISTSGSNKRLIPHTRDWILYCTMSYCNLWPAKQLSQNCFCHDIYKSRIIPHIFSNFFLTILICLNTWSVKEDKNFTSQQQVSNFLIFPSFITKYMWATTWQNMSLGVSE